MKNSNLSLIVVLMVLLRSAPSGHAIQGTGISIQGADVILNWPSVEGQRYVVRYSPVMNDNPPWVVLQHVPGAVGTNRTSYTHASIAQFAVSGG